MILSILYFKFYLEIKSSSIEKNKFYSSVEFNRALKFIGFKCIFYEWSKGCAYKQMKLQIFTVRMPGLSVIISTFITI